MNFNGPQLHLMVNHLPVVGFFLLTPVIALTAWLGDNRLKKLSLFGAMAISLLTLPAFWTGEPAEDGIEHLPGVSEHLIHEHEEVAEKALTLGLLTGGVALAGYVLSRKKESLLKLTVYSTLVGSVLTSLVMAKTAHDGGMIRHPEIRGDQANDPETTGRISNRKENGSDQEKDDDQDEK